MHRSDQLSY